VEGRGAGEEAKLGCHAFPRKKRRGAHSWGIRELKSGAGGPKEKGNRVKRGPVEGYRRVVDANGVFDNAAIPRSVGRGGGKN